MASGDLTQKADGSSLAPANANAPSV
jgi:hypothetical protein